MREKKVEKDQINVMINLRIGCLKNRNCVNYLCYVNCVW